MDQAQPRSSIMRPASALARALGSLALALGALVATVPLDARADSLTRGGEIWVPVPQAETKLLVDKATVFITLAVDDGPYEVLATLTLKNRGRKPETVKLALPERPCDTEKETCNGRDAGKYEAMRIVVGGTPLTAMPFEAAAEAPYRPDVGKVYGFDVEVAGRASVEVQISYKVAQTVDPEGSFGSVRGLGLWGRSLRALELRYHLPQRPWTLGHSTELKLGSYETAVGSSGPLAGKAETVVALTGKALKQRDVEVHFGTANKLGGAMRCPDPRAVAEAAAAEDAETRLGKLLVMRNDAELGTCRMLYLARQGFPFTDKEQAQRFYGKPVRSASLTETVAEGRDRPFLRYGMQPNSRYTSALHPKDESAFIDAIAAELRRRRGL